MAQARTTEAWLRHDITEIKSSRAWRLARALAALRAGLPRVRFWQRRDAREAARPGGLDDRTRRYRALLAAQRLTRARRRQARRQIKALGHQPLISVVMPVHDTDPVPLAQALESLRRQLYARWELCITDDASSRPETARVLERYAQPRIRVERLDRSQGIAAATNHAIAMANGEYLVFMDHDDELAADALFEIALEIERSGADFIYTDEDHIDRGGQRVDPHFKPDFSPDLLLSHNYITHLVAVRRDLLDRVGELRSEFDGAQDYDFVLRATEQAERIRHVPRVLYHWRMSDTSTASNAHSKPLAPERGRQLIEAALERRGRAAQVLADPADPYFYRVRYAIDDNPLVSILIPFQDRPELLHGVVGDILEKTTWGDFEILGIDNRSSDPKTRDAMRDLAGLDPRVRFLEYDAEFNFSAIMNYAASQAAGRHLVFMNNDMRLYTDEWLEALLEHSQRDEIGAVGGKLYYPDRRVQHAGIIVGIDGYAGHAHKGFPGDHQGYLNRLRVVHNVSAVTGAFMMIEKTVFDTVGGFDAAQFGVACNDVDLCLRLRERGLWNLFTPYAEACHIESASRGYEDSDAKGARFAAEKAVFAERHRVLLEQGDPFYNPNLTREREDFSIDPRSAAR